MPANPFKALLWSRKFWLGILDVVVSLTLYFTAKYSDPSFADDVKIVIGILQPLFITLIGSIAYEDAAAKKLL